MSFNIVFDYRFDETNFYGPDARDMLKLAADAWESIINVDFPAFDGGRTIDLYSPNFDIFDGIQTVDVKIEEDIDDLMIFMGVKEHIGALATGGTTWAKTFMPEYERVDTNFDKNDPFQPYLAQISFDPTPTYSNGRVAAWYYGPDFAPQDQFSFLGVAIHEIGHALGILHRTAEKFIENGFYDSESIRAVIGEPMPVDKHGHPEISFGNGPAMSVMGSARDPTMPNAVDMAMLLDLGYILNDTLPIDVEIPTGGEGNDSLYGGAGDDIINASVGNDVIDGGAGIDTAVYSGNQSSYSLTLSPTSTLITDRRSEGNGNDQLIDIEFLDFDTEISALSGQPLSLAMYGGPTTLSEENFTNLIELYIAYFNRAPDAVGLNFWGTAFANGMSLNEIAAQFAPQPETVATYPEGTSNAEFVTTVYNNVLGRGPDQEGLDFWVSGLEVGGLTRDTFILNLLGGVQEGESDRAYLDNKVDVGAYFAVHKGMSDAANAKAAMELYDGTESSIDQAVTAIDDYYQGALDPESGEFLVQVVGVLDNPFAA
jgi:hypothetical protein